MSKNNILLDIKNLKIEGFSDEKWHPIVKGRGPNPAPWSNHGPDR
jgi:hypothetical protein